MNGTIPDNKKVAPFILFYIVTSIQVGIGVLSFQRDIAKVAGYDAWISVIITGVATLIVIWMIFKMVQTVDGDFMAVISFLMGKWMSKAIGFFYMLYFCLLSITVLRNYIETIQVWMFPKISTFWFSLGMLILSVYVIYGGLKTVAGISFFSVILPIYILPLFLFTVPHADFTNLLPVFDHSVKDLLAGSYSMSLTVLGFEAIFFVYPFIKNPEKSRKWAYLAVLFITVNYLYLTILTFAYFSEEQLKKNIWPTLTMWKIIRMPFVERFEYIGIATWLLIVLPIICISLWIASRLAKQIFSVRQKIALLYLAAFVLVSTSIIITRSQVSLMSTVLGRIGFYANFCFIPLLFFATMIAKKVKKS